jgi:hypothetical protein
MRPALTLAPFLPYSDRTVALCCTEANAGSVLGKSPLENHSRDASNLDGH